MKSWKSASTQHDFTHMAATQCIWRRSLKVQRNGNVNNKENTRFSYTRSFASSYTTSLAAEILAAGGSCSCWSHYTLFVDGDDNENYLAEFFET